MPGILNGVLNITNDIFNRPEAWNVFSGGVGGGTYVTNTNAGVVVSEEKALTLSVWYAALRNLSEDIAKIPLDVFMRGDDGRKMQIDDHPVSYLYGVRPNTYMTPITYRQQMIFWLAGWGNAYARIHRNARMEPVELEPIHPARVTPKWDESGTRVIYEIRNWDPRKLQYAEIVTIDQDNMYHLRGLGGDALVGYSIIRIAAETIALSMAAEQFGASTFKNRGAIGALLTHPGTMSDKARANFKTSFEEAYRGAKNAGGCLIVEDGMQYQSMSLPPDDMQFLQTRTLQIEEMARIARMPLSKIGHLAKANYNSLEMQNLEYVTDTQLGYAIKWEQEDRRKLLRADEMNVFTRHNFKGQLRGDLKAQTEHLTKMWQIGVYSGNACLEYLDENPGGPELDKRFIPSNFQELKENMVAPWEAKQQATQKPRAAITEQQAYAVIWPFFDRVQKRAEKHIPVLQKRHGANLEEFTAALADFNAEMREMILTGLQDVWQSFNGDAAILQAALTGNQPILFEETARLLAAHLAKERF